MKFVINSSVRAVCSMFTTTVHKRNDNILFLSATLVARCNAFVPESITEASDKAWQRRVCVFAIKTQYVFVWRRPSDKHCF